ncbi:unnamed protein product [Mycena citricolor]|uniref:Galactose-binding like protein n=1 Tax=Mycena citricolor TaxID=2018698 RepID=A0AAD2K5T6_9AGAR|nr:unnamed protein product [Mycena citricolor]
MSQSLLSPDISIRVSSTLDKSVGKKHLVDNNPETCWTSQQGLPQYVQFTFPQPVVPQIVEFTFQGGFVATRCVIKVAAGLEEWKIAARIYPEDTNRRQSFTVKAHDGAEDPIVGGVDRLRLEFEESSDFFGRITLYDLKVLGSQMD